MRPDALLMFSSRSSRGDEVASAGTFGGFWEYLSRSLKSSSSDDIGDEWPTISCVPWFTGSFYFEHFIVGVIALWFCCLVLVTSRW
mmetsp:Transcript_24970/g.56533  ORF Transcript_24970/g.56533 Transcript_24970/m.56533 type:complete len:86 (+) Transcript_24970:389-646(+)